MLDAPLVRVAAGYGLPEAPRADAEGNVLFSDVVGGGVFRRSAGGEVATLLARRRGIGGLVPHRDGGVVVSGRDLCHVAGERSRQLLSPPGVTGFNDLTTDRDGGVVAGALRFRPFAGEQPAPGEVWRVAARGSATRLDVEVRWPNGAGFSPDWGTLYLSDYADGRVLACAMAADGSIGSQDVLAVMPRGSADGLAVDAEGFVWVALGDGAAIARIAPGGALDAVEAVDAAFVSSLCFGGPDRRDLFVTAVTEEGGVLLRGRAALAGLALPDAAV